MAENNNISNLKKTRMINLSVNLEKLSEQELEYVNAVVQGILYGKQSAVKEETLLLA